ncbi:MAG: DNA helicase, partial [Lachnospiraceae bacterium]|nr:DNA helicase [Lachnospiraceae bacterium]
MNHICRDVFRAIHEGKWLSIEYRNQAEQVTKYWIGIYDLDVRRRSLSVEGLHLGQYTTCRLDCIFIDSILSARIIDGSYFAVNKRLVEDISLYPDKYKVLFEHTANLKILNYLENCSRMDATPYRRDFALIRYLDRDRLGTGTCALSDEQFQSIVKHFQYRAEEEQEKGGRLQLQQLAMNVLSIHTQKGLYVMAYRKLLLDVAGRLLRPDEDITVCTEFTVEGQKESIRRYLDADEYEMLDRFEENQERIKECVSGRVRRASDVDDMPYVIGIGMDVPLDLHREYAAIIEMYEKREVTVPIQAFFGDLLGRPARRKTYPIALADKRINLDQLLAINNAMKYPVAYIQGPPGTGKTSTIINTIVTAFFNERTVLFSSYNNHPIDGVFKKLSGMQYQGRIIPFPILRLGNSDYRRRALRYMKKLREATRQVSVFDSTLDKNKDNRVQRARKLSDLLRRYEEVLDLRERSETIGR